MAFTREQLMAKAEASAAALAKIPAKQKGSTISDVIAKDFNDLRDLVIEANPDLERLLPARLQKTAGSYGMESHDATYQDVQAFYAQIAQIIKAGIPSAIRPAVR